MFDHFHLFLKQFSNQERIFANCLTISVSTPKKNNSTPKKVEWFLLVSGFRHLHEVAGWMVEAWYPCHLVLLDGAEENIVPFPEPWTIQNSTHEACLKTRFFANWQSFGVIICIYIYCIHNYV